MTKKTIKETMRLTEEDLRLINTIKKYMKIPSKNKRTLLKLIVKLDFLLNQQIGD